MADIRMSCAGCPAGIQHLCKRVHPADAVTACVQLHNRHRQLQLPAEEPRERAE